MTTESNPPGFLDAVGELIGELGTLLPKLVERSRDQLAVVSKVVEQLPCLAGLGNRVASDGDAHTPDLHLVPGGVDATDDDRPEQPAPPTKAPAARKAPAKKAPAKKKAPAAKAPAKKKAPAAKAPARKAPARKAPAPAGTAPPAAGPLAIPDYDELAASQVIPRLDSLTATELEAIRAYEAANRGRRTILSRVAQLQTS